MAGAVSVIIHGGIDSLAALAERVLMSGNLTEGKQDLDEDKDMQISLQSVYDGYAKILPISTWHSSNRIRDSVMFAY